MTSNSEQLTAIRKRAEKWLDPLYDEQTNAEVKAMLDNDDPTELTDAFYKNLEFGTGGLRGVMGTGSNRMNKYTVGSATQGLANYINKEFSHLSERKVVIGHDCRNNSRYFAETVAQIFSANNITAYLFEDLRPTPEISFAIRHLKCQSGVIITASHNPKEYNGFKAYWDDGAQIIAPHDKNIIDEVANIESVSKIKFEGNKKLIKILGNEIDKLFIKEITNISLNKKIIENQKNLKIVFSPIHGTTVNIVPSALQEYGFNNIINIPEQDIVDGNFPTVISPNPEDPEALKMAIKKAEESNADMVAACDPDGDRLGIAVKNEKGEFILLNGNQTALLLTWYMITQWKKQGYIKGEEFVVKTIVTSEIIKTIADNNSIECFDSYTGFKWIASIIRELEGEKKYICGGEESYGFLPGDYVRDKDAVGSICMMAEIAAWAKDHGKTVYELLKDIYIEYGFSYEHMVSIVRKGKSGAEEINAMMDKFRNNPPKEVAGSTITVIKDFDKLEEINLLTGKKEKLNKPAPSNVLQFFTKDGSKISARPSGTEPKIKFYFEVKGELKERIEFNSSVAKAKNKIDAIIKDMKIE
ncbi:phospho-sugar mutase [Marinilabiliaceae bacterium ANBcel2]|nr:phospho-sugar mutase [Marinilabiliaceae bacterium ANBcel2]